MDLRKQSLVSGKTYCDEKHTVDYLRKQALEMFNLSLRCSKQLEGGWLVAVRHRRRRPQKVSTATITLPTPQKPS
jgi:hypothetical protein